MVPHEFSWEPNSTRLHLLFPDGESNHVWLLVSLLYHSSCLLDVPGPWDMGSWNSHQSTMLSFLFFYKFHMRFCMLYFLYCRFLPSFLCLFPVLPIFLLLSFPHFPHIPYDCSPFLFYSAPFRLRQTKIHNQMKLMSLKGRSKVKFQFSPFSYPL